MAIGLYAVLIELFWIEVTQHFIPTQSSRQITLVQLSDLHMQSVGKREEQILTVVTEIKPDIIVLSGDVIDNKDNLPVLDEFLKGLPETNIVATLGNWEYWGDLNLRELYSTYARHHAYLLVDESQTFNIDGRLITVTGLDDLEGRPELPSRDRTLKDATEILVQHSPGYFVRFETNDLKDNPPRFALCLSGHTHGGQVTLFGKPLWTPPGSGQFVAGMYETSVCPLYVSRGLGTSILPMRIWARPEIAVVKM